jgi:signal transduction histidine kinase
MAFRLALPEPFSLRRRRSQRAVIDSEPTGVASRGSFRGRPGLPRIRTSGSRPPEEGRGSAPPPLRQGGSRESTQRRAWPDPTFSHPLDRLIDLAHRSSLERRLAVARLLAALAILLAVGVGTGPDHLREAVLLMVGYVAYAAGILAFAWRFPLEISARARFIHVADLGWATAVTAVSGGASSHTFALFLLVLAASAYRWGLRGSMRTGTVIVVIVATQGLAAANDYLRWPFELDTFIELTGSVVLFAGLFGLLSHRLHALGAHAIALGDILERVGRASGLGGAVEETLGQVLALFEAESVVIVGREFDGEAVACWHAQPQQGRGSRIGRIEVPSSSNGALFLPVPGGARTWEVRCHDSDATADAMILAADGTLTSEAVARPSGVPGATSCRVLTIAALDAPELWIGRLFLVNPARPRDARLRLALLQKLVEQLTPTLASLYLMRRLRSRAEASERARLARELHDGVVQTLATLELRLEAAARGVGLLDGALSTELHQIRDALRADLLNVREVLGRVRPVDVEAASLPGELRDRIERFSTMSGISGKLAWSGNAGDLTGRQRQEMLRIVQESLVNVRRHSAASRVLVRVAADASDWEVVVEDDGRGFGFTGRRTHAELKERGEGPRVIRERVELLGGTLELESSPGGARLEIGFPRGRS